MKDIIDQAMNEPIIKTEFATTSGYTAIRTTKGGTTIYTGLIEYSKLLDEGSVGAEHGQSMISGLVAHYKVESPINVMKAINRVLSDIKLAERFGFGGDLYMSEDDPGYQRYKEEVLDV